MEPPRISITFFSRGETARIFPSPLSSINKHVGAREISEYYNSPELQRVVPIAPTRCVTRGGTPGGISREIRASRGIFSSIRRATDDRWRFIDIDTQKRVAAKYVDAPIDTR